MAQVDIVTQTDISVLVIRPDRILSGNSNLGRDTRLHHLMTLCDLIVVDFRQTSLIDFRALQQLICLQDWANQLAIEYRFANVTGQVASLFKMANVSHTIWQADFAAQDILCTAKS